MENRRPGCCSWNVYNVGYDVVIAGDNGDNDDEGDGDGEVKEGMVLFFLDFKCIRKAGRKELPV
jgi:hypothetical protein